MFTLFGLLSPATGAPAARDEAPFKRSFFGEPIEPSAASRIEEEALYLAGKRPEPAERPRLRPQQN